MAKVQDPILFSTYFGLSAETLEEAGLIDPFLNVDTQLFIDPTLLEKSSNEIIKDKALAEFRQHFENFLRLLAISEQEGDTPWRTAQRLLDLSEPADNGLGYGGSGRSGSSRPKEIRDKIVKTAKEIVTLGSKDPEMLGLMGFFEEDVGPDTISDFTTRVISKQLSEITEKFCLDNNIPTSKRNEEDQYSLPSFIVGRGKRKYVLLVPSDIVRDLPIANDPSEIYNAISFNQKIRERVNAFLANSEKTTAAHRKEAVRKAALESAELFNSFLETIKAYTQPYNQEEDSLGYRKLKEILRTDVDLFKVEEKFELSTGPEKVLELVHATISAFKHHVENGNLWEALWENDKPKRERASQLIYFAVADCFCKANNIDISPEANMGGGPVDFKFSKGYEARVLVEMKRSKGTVEHGYGKQLKYYKKAAKTFFGIFVVIDYGDLGNKLLNIQKMRAERIEAGENASDIVVIDATKKQSASKRD